MAPNITVEGSNSMGNEAAPRPSSSEQFPIDSCIATASDEKAIKCLAQASEIYESTKKKMRQGPRDNSWINDHFCETDPRKLPKSFVMSGELLSSLHKLDQPLYRQELKRRMDQLMACWNPVPVTGLHSAIRGTDDARYVGTRQVWKLHPKEKDSTESGWFMASYSLLSATPTSCDKKENKDDESEVLYLDLKRQYVFADFLHHLPSYTKQLLQKGFLHHLSGMCLSLYAAGQSHGPRSSSSCCSSKQRPTKMREVSDVWKHKRYTKIYDGDFVYAACHHYNKIFNASSKNGTTHLKKHSETCITKNRLRSLGLPTWFELANCSDKDELICLAAKFFGVNI